MESRKSLKARNSIVLGAALVADTIVFFALTHERLLSEDWKQVLSVRAALVVVAPLVVLLLNGMLPASWKARLVFWRWRYPLPGHRAFSERTLNDPRIDVERLRKNIGAFPDAPGEQNYVWYRLFKKVESDPSIEHVNQQYLLLRDLAAVSFILLVVVVGGAATGALPTLNSTQVSAILLAQYLLAALGARSQGMGLVSSVLAMHGVKRRV